MTTQTKPQIVAESPTPSATGKSCGDENAQPPEAPGTEIVQAKPEKKAMIAFENGSAKIDSVEGLFRIAEIFWRGGMLPAGVNKIEQVMIALMAGSEIGLSPVQSIQNIMVINNRPTLWGDAPLALARASGLVLDIKEIIEGEGDEMTATCTVYRKGSPTPTVRTFSAKDAIRAGLWGKPGPWKSYPQRMLKFRARGFALRDSVPDVLKGLGIAEEIADIEVRGYQNRRTPGADAGVDAAADIAALPQSDPTTTNGSRAAAPGQDVCSTVGTSSPQTPGAAPSPAGKAGKAGAA